MRILFCGTPQFAVPTLKYLLGQNDFEIAGVITQPDRPRGRGQQVSFSAVKQAALAAKIAVHQPEKIRAPEVQELLQALAPDGVVIIAYGQIIPPRLLPIPKLGWINLHASLLPKYRGAAPINWAAGKRSEEHTSELQSHSDLVCRLLLEKKKKNRVVFEILFDSNVRS